MEGLDWENYVIVELSEMEALLIVHKMRHGNFAIPVNSM